MNVAGAIEQHVDCTNSIGELLDRAAVANVKLLGADQRLFVAERASDAASISVASTSAPSRAKASAVARPIPCPAAVRSAFFPCNRPVMQFRGSQ